MRRDLVDFYVPSRNLVIEVDGVFWHRYPKKRAIDARKARELEARGIGLVRVDDTDLVDYSAKETA